MLLSVFCRLTLLLCWVLAPSCSGGQSDDKWGPWSEWSPCSRTCGVGVTYQERECFEKEKPEAYCKGNKRMYETCNIQDCPEGSRDFRLEQCEAYNSRVLDGRKFKWVPYIPTHERCVLNCMPKGENFFMQWASKVADGTRCSVDSYDICVDGKCEKLGCDLILNSTAKEDKCRVCNGIGENCKTHKGVTTDVGDGYKEILVIPASATNIDIQEVAPSSNFLALSDSSQSYFFNGDYFITSPRKFHIAGTVFNYERTGFGQERISSLGPTSIPVHVEILLMGEKNPGISYEFSLPTSVTVLPERAQFIWRTGDFDKCSASCAGGEQKRRVYCVRKDTGEEASKSNCDHGKKPSHKQKCNTQSCPASWYVSSWSSCSVTCRRGKQVRRVHCQHVVEGGNAEMIPDDQCPGQKAITMRDCQILKRCPVWSVGQWSKCSVSCGVGSKHRNLTCQLLDTRQVFEPESCNPNRKPKETESCNPGPCTVAWMATEWSECYPKCGKGMSTRMVYCVSITDKTKKYPDELCDVSSRPINEKNCSSDVLCPPMWHASQWSKCTATCGVGMQMRNVYCATKEGPKMLRILKNDQCANETKIKGMQMCSVRPCQAGWYIYPWEPCSTTCGLGLRRRNVKCFADSKEDPEEKWCKAEDKPVSAVQCLQKKCKEAGTTTKAPEKTTTAAALQTVSTLAPAAETEEEKLITTLATTQASKTEERQTTETASPATTSTEEAKSTSTTESSEEPTTTAAQTQTTKTVEEERTTFLPATAQFEQTTTTGTSQKPIITTAQVQTTKAGDKESTTTASPLATTQFGESTTSEAEDGITTTAATQTQTTKAGKEELTTTATPVGERTTRKETTTTSAQTVEEERSTIKAKATEETITTFKVATEEEATKTSTSKPPSASTLTAESTRKTEISTQSSTTQDFSTETSTIITMPFSSEARTTTSTHPTQSSTISNLSPTIDFSTTTVSVSTIESTTTEASKTITPPPTTEASTTTTPPPTTEASTTTIPPPTTEVSATTIPPPTTEASTTTIPPLTTEASTTTTPPPTTEASTTTIPPPTTEASTTTTPPPTAEASTTTTPPPTTEASTTTIPPPTTEASATTTPPPTTEASTTTIPPSTTEASTTTTPPPTTETSTSTAPESSTEGPTTALRIKPAKIFQPPQDTKPTTKPPEKCEDNPLIAHCPVVKRVGFCCIKFYQKACCYTCRDLLPGCKS
ncbi:papilin-like isoform X2 [Porites lutea]|uniref:papilin-like isoform X2 n=1 Tax=Porites lutea TaxID=51062 RepID=UPI003CC58063